MSRTIRRPNYLDTIGVSGSHKEDFFNLVSDERVGRGMGHGGYWTVRPMTKPELREHMLRMYGDSHRNARGPGRNYRKPREVEMRSHNKQELLKWRNDPEEYEPMVWANPLSCLWDWS